MKAKSYVKFFKWQLEHFICDKSTIMIDKAHAIHNADEMSITMLMKCHLQCWWNVIHNADEMSFTMLMKCHSQYWWNVIHNADEISFTMLMKCHSQYWWNVIHNADEISFTILMKCHSQCWWNVIHKYLIYYDFMKEIQLWTKDAPTYYFVVVHLPV